MADPSERFPSDFVWGAATSSYQIEGAVDADGRGPSIWDDFCKVPGAISDGSDGAVACDHYHRMPEDVGLMAELGLQAYRFSVAWPRVLPQGRGPVNGPGLDFYDRLVDRLLAAGIAPWVTLYHWDLPSALQAEGGWVSRSTAEAFADYARVVAERLGDRVRHWTTHNEPWCASALGHLEGVHAPGIKSQFAHVASGHHLLLSHGLAVPVIRAAAPDSQVGITLALVKHLPPENCERSVCVRRLNSRGCLTPHSLGLAPGGRATVLCVPSEIRVARRVRRRGRPWRRGSGWRRRALGAGGRGSR